MVNSPGLAILAPRLIQASITCLSTKAEPWQEISTTSSPVYERGDLKTDNTTSSKRPDSSCKTPT